MGVRLMGTAGVGLGQKVLPLRWGEKERTVQPAAMQVAEAMAEVDMAAAAVVEAGEAARKGLGHGRLAARSPS